MMFLVIVFLMLAGGCQRVDTFRYAPSSPQPPGGAHARVVNPQDGCDEQEAAELARRYYNSRFAEEMEGGMMPDGQTEDSWVFSVIVGYAGVHEGDILVSKKNGFVSYVKE